MDQTGNRTFPLLSYKWWTFLAIAIGLFTSVADQGSVIVALPTISEHFATDLPTAQWVLIGYSLAVSALLLPMGRLSDIVGRKRVYLSGFGLFVLGAALAASAGSIALLVGARVVMGVGSAMIQGTSMAMVISTFPEAERGKALGLQMSAVGSGGVAGPVMGGLIVGTVGWQGVFLASVVLGLAAIVAGQIVLPSRPNEAEKGPVGFDWLGAGLSSLVLITFLLAVSNGATVGWTSPAIVIAAVALAALLAVFIWWELASSNPMLDMRLFKRPLFAFGALTRFGSFLGISSVRFLMPFYLQAVRGYTAAQVGLIVVPSAVALILMGPLGGRLSDRLGWRLPSVSGLVLTALGLLVLSRLTELTPLGLVVAAMVLQSVGNGIFGAPNSSSVLSVVERERYGVVSGFLNLVRNAGNVTGIGVATAIVTAVMASHGVAPSLAEVAGHADPQALTAFVSGLRVAYVIAAVMVLLGAFLSLSLKGDSASLQSAS